MKIEERNRAGKRCGIYATVNDEGEDEPADQRTPMPSSSVVGDDDAEPADQTGPPLPSSSSSAGCPSGEPHYPLAPHALTPRPSISPQWSMAAPCPQPCQGSALPSPFFPPAPPGPVPQAQEEVPGPVPPAPPGPVPQSTLLQTLAHSDRGGTITVSPDGTTSVTFDARGELASERPVATRWQLAGGKGNGKWMTSKRQRALAYRHHLQELESHGVSPPPPRNSFVMCRLCGRCQAGQDCTNQCCAPCCVANYEWCSHRTHTFA
jgi:hypothetical protein